ncbi:hypothetical protein Aph02nite_27640 [Actinoplanes philippinensis]|nr:hypothetical protein Aph02nite_27640 [Actinoplanes philippinensis]
MTRSAVRVVIPARVAAAVKILRRRTVRPLWAYPMGEGSANPTSGGVVAPFSGFSGTRTVKDRLNGEDDDA